MRTRDRARFAAPAVLAAVAGTAAVGVAALAREGVCVHRLGWFGLRPPAVPATPMAGMPMPGMEMSGTNAPCPILVGAAIVAALLYVAALVAIVATRPRPSDLAFAAARIVVGVRLLPLAFALGAIAAVPFGALVVMDGGGAAVAFAGAVFLALSALLGAATLTALARVTLAFARRLVDALLAAPWVPRDRATPGRFVLHTVPARAGVRLARRRPSRAPPLR